MKKTALVAALILSAATSAHAQQQCGDRGIIIAQLTGKYHEWRRSAGIVNEKMIAELFVSAEGTWTIIATLPMGKACIIAAGSSWDNTEDKPISKGRPL